ncbi:MAG: aminoacyl-tRNA hydrolase [Cryomorphaceae bacterium]|nr:aminoacyl-tRNA hydrolase [Cryomorphaceae bacterium]
MKKYLIVGLGNIGSEYEETRHNIGFKVLDRLANRSGISFSSDRLAFHAELRIKGRILTLIKPSTYMNLSGKAVRYWMDALKIPIENVLVVVDDVALPFAQLRLKTKGSDGGHNGLKSIQQLLGGNNYPRLRIGIGGDFPKGGQVDYVLGQWTEEEQSNLPKLTERCADAIESFCLAGVSNTMNAFNGDGIG